MTRLLSFSLVALLFSALGAAQEDLDELVAREARKAVNTFYSGELAGNDYIWQPQLVIYVDTSTDHEVWIWTQTDNEEAYTGHEYGTQPWSADGKRMALCVDMDTTSYTRGSGYWYYPWLVMRSDGTYMRPGHEFANRMAGHNLWSFWSPTEPDIIYQNGNNTAGNIGLDENMIYKHTVSDTSISRETWVDLIAADTSTELTSLKDHISADGKYMMMADYPESTPLYIAQITGTPQLTLTYAFPSWDPYWFEGTETVTSWHDEMFVGNGEGYWIYALRDGWWRIRPWGSDSGTPSHVQDHTAEYDWWGPTQVALDANKEIQPVNNDGGDMPDFVDVYWSHGVADRWGTHVLFSDVDNSPIGPGVFDVDGESQTAINTIETGTQYHAWTGWTDYGVSSTGSPSVNIGITLYDSSNNSDHELVAELHSSTASEFTKPGQSPDGTKVSMRSDWLNTAGDVFIGIAYWPYPPEITACTATGGTVTTRVDWRLNQASPRGYTERGWPHETDDDPSPPRETELFRLWRSPDGSNWTSVDTTNAEIFTRYDFGDGTWDGNSYWDLTDTPGDGAWYYAVTALEWSGLESHALSNIYSITVSSGSGTGSQDTGYPSSPGGDSDFFFSYVPPPRNVVVTHQKAPAAAIGQYTLEWDEAYSDYVRQYNVYAEDGSVPTISQINRVASVPVGWCSAGSCSWVDWLGKTDGTTEYVITSVDYQGNESSDIGAIARRRKEK